MKENISKHHNTTDEKLHTVWDDVKKLIALENELLERIKELEKKIARIMNSINDRQ